MNSRIISMIRYIFPALCGLFVTYLYNVVDRIFVGQGVGAAANIFLDWLFIYPLGMGIIGAAIASGLGQVLTVVILMTHFLRKKGDLRISAFKPDLTLIAKVCKRGVPEAVTQLTTPVTALCYNLVLARLIGDIGVSTFSVLSFIYSLANAIL